MHNQSPMIQFPFYQTFFAKQCLISLIVSKCQAYKQQLITYFLLQQKSTELRRTNKKTMQYQDFIKKSFRLISEQRNAPNQHFAFSNIIQYVLPKNLQPSNIFLQLYVRTSHSRIKLEQWSFITHKTLLKSVNCEDQDSDPQLDDIQIQTQNFFQILQKLLKNVSPKVLTKKLKPHSIEFVTVTNESNLTSFQGDSAFVIKVGDYESINYDCSVSIKYDYQYDDQQQQQQQIGSQDRDSCEFQLLVDPVFEQKRKQYQDQYKQTRKLSQGNIYQRQFSPQPLTKQAARSEAQKQKTQIDENQQDPDLKKITNLFKEIDFESVKGSTLGEFLAYIK